MGCGHPRTKKINPDRLPSFLSELVLHNTLTSKKETFSPMRPGRVGLYVCGITPYDEAHVGHARCYVVFDILRRMLEHEAYKVNHIQNYTDVEDKIIDRARKENISPSELANRYIASYEESMKALNVLPAHKYPRVTDHIPQIIDLIKKLEERGMAYVSGDTVYFAVRKFKEYGALSKRNIDELEEGARVGVDPKKKDPLDFALWKGAKDGEPSWPSPWGAGRPGWHIECSVMSTEYLGEEFDIHGGGQDLIFPHHENEIAQFVGATGKGFARTWVHNGFVTINKEKMSKSLGNFFSLRDVLATVSPMGLRYFLLSQHYKSPLNFSDTELKNAESTWNSRIVGAYRICEQWLKKTGGEKPLDPKIRAEIDKIQAEFISGLKNDLNTPIALASLNKLCTEIFEIEKKVGPALRDSDKAVLKSALQDELDLLGLAIAGAEDWGPEIMDLVQQREAARKNKQWSESDRLRDELKNLGVIVQDTPSGPRLQRV